LLPKRTILGTILVVKGHLFLQIVESVWLKHLILYLSSSFHDVLPGIMEKTKQTNVLPFVEECHSTIVSFDLCMSKGAHDVFALDITCLGSN